MTRLLVSVRDAIEARIAVDAGADLIDLKEPARGPLGAVDAAVAEDCLRLVDGRVAVSLALGELLDRPPGHGHATPRGAAFAKFGLAGCALDADWPGRWATACAQFAAGTHPVAVVYADWRAAAAPSPAEVLEQAAPLACRAVLVDTFDKSAGGLIDHWTIDELARFARLVRLTDMLLVLAGSLDYQAIRQVLPLEPDYVAVRGAVCLGGRSGRLDAGRTRRLRDLVRGKGKTMSHER